MAGDLKIVPVPLAVSKEKHNEKYRMHLVGCDDYCLETVLPSGQMVNILLLRVENSPAE